MTSLDALFQYLRMYAPLPQDALRVFTAYHHEELNEMLAQENSGLASYSLTAGQFLQAKGITLRANRSKREANNTAEPATPRMAYPPAIAPDPSLAGCGMPVCTPAASGMSAWERRRMELEQGPGGDHDVPYVFALPVSTPQTLTWIRLLARVQRGELEL